MTPERPDSELQYAAPKKRSLFRSWALLGAAAASTSIPFLFGKLNRDSVAPFLLSVSRVFEGFLPRRNALHVTVILIVFVPLALGAMFAWMAQRQLKGLSGGYADMTRLATWFLMILCAISVIAIVSTFF